MGAVIFNPPQQEVVDHGLLTSGFSCVLQMATGSGKTWLSSHAIRDSLESGHRAIYLSPLRALAEELAVRWTSDFSGFNVGIFTGDYGPQGKAVPVPYEKSNLLIMTPERLDACTRSWRSHWAWLPQVDLVVVDEIHLLGDPGRGARLEGAISRLRRLNPFVRFLGLSATLGNRGELADWLDGVEFHSSWRPVPLRWRVSRFRKAQEKPDLLCREAAGLRDSGGQSLVFVQSRRRSEVLAKHLCSQGIQAGYHHAGLQHSERRSIEEAFRQNRTPVLIATGTLEMGLNLPARQVILYDLQGFDDGEFSPLPSNTVWQRAGRAGRPGFDDEGEAVLFASSWDKSVDAYEQGRFENIRSGFRDRAAFEEQVLVEIQSGMGRTAPQLERVFSTSLAARQKIAIPIEESISSMAEAGIVDLHPDTGDFRVTPLGRVAIRQMLRPSTVLHIRRFLASVAEPTFFDLLVGAASSDDCEPKLAVDFEELENLSDSLAARPTNLFAAGSSAPRPADGKRLLSALKTAAALIEWTRSGDADAVAEEFGCYPFEIIRLRESMERILMAVGSVQRLLDPAAPEGEEKPKSLQLRRIEILRQMIINGLDVEAAALTLVDGIGPKWAKKLIGAGFQNLAQLGAASAAEVVSLGGISEKRAVAWIQDAGMRSQEGSVTDAHSQSNVSVHPTSLSLGEDPYRLRRATELSCTVIDSSSYQVTGGLEPHIVRCFSENATLVAYTSTPKPSAQLPFSCDCPDHAKGNTCKHILSVRLARGDAGLSRAVEQICRASSDAFLDLLQLWFAR